MVVIGVSHEPSQCIGQCRHWHRTEPDARSVDTSLTITYSGNTAGFSTDTELCNILDQFTAIRTLWVNAVEKQTELIICYVTYISLRQ